jgi:hypothetical protein
MYFLSSLFFFFLNLLFILSNENSTSKPASPFVIPTTNLRHIQSPLRKDRNNKVNHPTVSQQPSQRILVGNGSVYMSIISTLINWNAFFTANSTTRELISKRNKLSSLSDSCVELLSYVDEQLSRHEMDIPITNERELQIHWTRALWQHLRNYISTIYDKAREQESN